jgi:hypothetical protein
MGVYRIADPITTNQKVAGSSPAEALMKVLQKRGFFFARSLEGRPGRVA